MLVLPDRASGQASGKSPAVRATQNRAPARERRRLDGLASSMSQAEPPRGLAGSDKRPLRKGRTPGGALLVSVLSHAEPVQPGRAVECTGRCGRRVLGIASSMLRWGRPMRAAESGRLSREHRLATPDDAGRWLTETTSLPARQNTTIAGLEFGRQRYVEPPANPPNRSFLDFAVSWHRYFSHVRRI